jgi:RNA polymerase sigma-70 factor (ECF subfamily)
MLSMSSTRTNEEWLYALNASGEIQEAAITDLRDLLLRATLYFFNRNLGDLKGLDHDEILQRAEDCAQEALIAVMSHLSDFRGDSKFTTWAYKFAINIALMTARRERWKGKSLDQLSFLHNGRLFEWQRQDGSSGLTPDRFAIQDEISDILREVIERDLTEKQRVVLIMMVFNEVPMDEVVQRLGTNRNAIYKMLHEARRKLKSSLQARGFEVSEMLALFSEPR